MKSNLIRAVVLLLAVLAPAAASAQLNTGFARPQGPIQIKDHPQKSVYNSPAEWPLVDGQGHWCPGGAAADCRGNNPARLSHGHLGCQAPIYAFITGPVTFPCRIMLFHTAGHLKRLDFSGPGRAPALNTNVVFDGTGTDRPPTMAGNPDGLVTLTFIVTMDPSNWPVKHGMALFVISIEIAFDNRDQMGIEVHLPFWSALDTTEPPTLGSGPNRDYVQWPITVDMGTQSARGASAGNQIVRLWDYIPLPGEALTKPWRLYSESGRYGSGEQTRKIPAGFTELRTDVNLHAFVEGNLVQRVDSLPGSQAPVVIVHDFFIDPSKLAAGQHNAMLRWGLPLKDRTDIFAGGEEVQALLTFPFSAGPGGTPPVPRDSDGDGVIDDNDVCPNTPPGTAVDHHSGCPVTPGATSEQTRMLLDKLAAGQISIWRLIAQMLLGGGL
ncbi:MAG TPA: thrombospondin type 3 repeat-containing protein [Vicinamibacterales bacterium]|nr:thrombospondin type 3 repeat-containing protein [Vicinamibacterales bacterium]